MGILVLCCGKHHDVHLAVPYHYADYIDEDSLEYIHPNTYSFNSFLLQFITKNKDNRRSARPYPGPRCSRRYYVTTKISPESRQKSFGIAGNDDCEEY